MGHPELLGVGEVARRSGVSVSTLHFYERKGLVGAERTPGNQRRYRREVLRRIAFIRVSQRVGMSLREIREALDLIGETPTRRDWARVSRRWRDEIDQRIHDLEHLRDDLGDCIGCGCLSMRACRLANPQDRLAETGPGPRRWEE